jgi:Ribbon-helix-helix domain
MPNRGAPVRIGSVGHHKKCFFFKISFPGIESPVRCGISMNLGLHQMKSLVVKRSVHINGHKTSVSLEDAFWSGLKEIADAQGTTLSAMVEEIDETRTEQPILSDTPVRPRPGPQWAANISDRRGSRKSIGLPLSPADRRGELEGLL